MYTKILKSTSGRALVAFPKTYGEIALKHMHESDINLFSLDEIVVYLKKPM